MDEFRIPRWYDSELVSAVKQGDLNKVRRLLDAGVDIHDKCDKALRTAARIGSVEMARLLLDRGASVDAALPSQRFEGWRQDAKWTPLSWAASCGNLGVMELLIDRGADVDALEGQALECASLEGRVESVRLLLDRGASVIEGKRALSHAMTCGIIASIRNSNEHNLLVVTPTGVDTEIARLLLDRGCTPCKDDLEIAAKTGNINLVRLLLERGADVGPDEGIVRRVASVHPPEEILELLLSALREKFRTPKEIRA